MRNIQTAVYPHQLKIGHTFKWTYFIYLVVCLTRGPKPLAKRALHIVRSRASSFKWEYPLLSLRSSNSVLRLLPCLLVTSIPPCIFPSVIRCRRQFLRKMWPIQFAFRLRISCRIFLCSLTLSNTSSFLIYLEYFIIPLLKIFTIPPQSPCISNVVYRLELGQCLYIYIYIYMVYRLELRQCQHPSVGIKEINKIYFSENKLACFMVLAPGVIQTWALYITVVL